MRSQFVVFLLIQSSFREVRNQQTLSCFSAGAKEERDVTRHFGKFFLYSSSIFSTKVSHWYWQSYPGRTEMIEKAIVTEHPDICPALPSGSDTEVLPSQL